MQADDFHDTFDLDVDVYPWDRPHVPSTAQVALGLFVMGQLAFLVLANFLGLLEDTRKRLADEYRDKDKLAGWLKGEGHVHDLQTVLTGVCDRWSQVTHSPQSWSLFAPTVATRLDFPAIELRWDDDQVASDHQAAELLGPLTALATGGDFETLALWASLPPRQSPAPSVWLLSENEPEDLRSFLRLGRFRLRRLESNIGVTMIVPPDKTRADVVDGWRSSIQDKLRSYWRMHFNYLRWRVREWQRLHPDAPPPTQVVLWVRQYSIPAPDAAPSPWTWNVHESQRMARWRPHAPRLANHLPLDMYNPVTERFESIWSSDADDEP